QVPACGELEVEPVRTVGTSAQPGDGRSTIEWVPNWSERGLGGDVAATTDVQLVREDGIWRIAEADVYLNGEVRWDVFHRGPITTSLEAVLVHEFGHVLGLLHPCEGPSCDAVHQASALFPTHEMNAGTLSADDVEGMCFLYPASSCAVSCGAGSVCVDGACEEVCTNESCEARPDGSLCRSDGECLSGLCAVGFCTTECRGDAECELGLSCGAGGWCEASTDARASCESGEDCETGLCLTSVEGGMCTTSCVDEFVCLAGERCEELSGASVCVPRDSSGCSAAGDGATSSMFLTVLVLFGARRRNGWEK
ncbi:MAG: matrixin family metalloprotease, partial [Myxococcota bacterium]